MIEAGTTRSLAAGNASIRAVRFAAWRFVLQRGSAVLLAVFVVVHLATIIHAEREGLSAAAIVARLHANPFWPAFYTLFVVAVSVHAPLGLRAIADEWLGLRGRRTDAFLSVLALALLAGGLYAVRSLAA